MTDYELPGDEIATFQQGPDTLYLVDIDFAAGKFHFILYDAQGHHKGGERLGFTEFHRMYRRNDNLYRTV